MSPLNIHPEEGVTLPKKKKNKSLKIMLGIAALVAVPVVGTTLAASIGINLNGETSTPIQFGQGQVQAVVCDPTVTVTADAVYENAAGNGDGTFSLGDVVLTGILDACDGKFFTVSVYNATAEADPIGVCTGVQMDIDMDGGSGGGTCGAGSTALVDYAIYNTANNQNLTIQFGAANISSQNVYKITVETSSS